MTWVFLVLTVAGLGITLRIIVEYLHEAGRLKAEISRIRYATLDAESQIEELKFAKQQADLRATELGKTSSELQKTADELLDKISAHRKGRESRGKFAV